MNKLKLWDAHTSWDQAEKTWDETSKHAETLSPLKRLKVLPEMPGITKDTAKFLKWKALKWMVSYDQEWIIFKHFLRHPFKYTWRLLKSYFKGKSYKRNDDFFLYGINSVDALTDKLKDENTLLVVGFSYCHKPFECPSKRFTAECIHDLSNPICQQCFIGKVMHALPEKRTLPLIIPTIHYVGDQIFKTVHANPDKEVLFLITACEMTLEMFGDWGNMAGIKGIGVRLDGRICNTLKAFELSEIGIKPGLTTLLPKTETKILDIIKKTRHAIK